MIAIDAIRLIDDIDLLTRSTRKEKSFQERRDPFLLNDEEFRMRYRFSKGGVEKIINLVKSDISLDKRGFGTSPKLQVLVALRCWGRREVQGDAGDLHGLSQATVSRICVRVATALAKHADNIIKMPETLAQEQALMRSFKAVKNFPNVIGAIDCTHIKIKKVGGDISQYYINRKGYYSLNVQVSNFDYNLTIETNKEKLYRQYVMQIGSTHDCRIFDESSLKANFEEAKFKGRLLGDSGYKLTPYLFTPILRPQNEKEERYNIAHIGTRNAIERCFGVWKQRFRCLLDGMTVSLQNAKTLIVALAVLHNFAIVENENTEEFVNNISPCNNAMLTPDRSRDEIPEGNPASQRRANIILKMFIDSNF
ncbi:PREDICTED: putative nuclease HARBI1 [Rhagoletis zephyria]|uniref:putative nuclease HARBI1 n=1 Tax=Rhagoletis zephyria TaxID=28612 RepID=UPI0008117A1F|nr:PREDICTED: putative nuclease HARBI1 [Rhagoletis zephyria]